MYRHQTVILIIFITEVCTAQNNIGYTGNFLLELHYWNFIIGTLLNNQKSITIVTHS